MGIEEEPPFDSAKIPNIVTIVLMVVILVLHRIQFEAAGDWNFYTFAFERFLIIFWGFIVPAAILVLAILGKKIYQDNEYITLSFGIIIVVLSGILTFISSYWAVKSMIDMVGNIDYGLVVILCYVIMEACIAVVLVMQIKSLLTGVQLIKSHQAA